MRIVVNDIAAVSGGAMSVLKDFYSAVCEYDKENEWIFILNSQYFEQTDNVRILVRSDVKKSKIKKVLFDWFTGRRFINKLKPDVVLSMQNIITFGVKAPQIAYVHQSIPFQSVKKFSFFRSSERKLAVVQHIIGRIIKRSVKKSDAVVVQTEWMKEAVCQACHKDCDKVYTILPTVKSESAISQDLTFDKSSFFYPTANAIYKNNTCVRLASDMLDKKNISHNVILTLPAKEENSSVTYVGKLPHEKVMEQYKRSTLIFPSYIETFGYPLAEAAISGSIVLASDTLFSHEVLRDYPNAYFFDPFKPEELAALMEKVISGEIVREETDWTKQFDSNSWLRLINLICSWNRNS